MKTFSMISLRLWMQDHLRLQKDRKKYRQDPTKDLVLSDLTHDIDYHEQILLDHCSAWVDTNIYHLLVEMKLLPAVKQPAQANQAVNTTHTTQLDTSTLPHFHDFTEDQLNDLSRTIITLAGVAIAIVALCSSLYIWNFYGV